MSETQASFGSERFTYTIGQMKWIANALAKNNYKVSAVLELMADRSSAFPSAETFRDAANWSIYIEKVKNIPVHRVLGEEKTVTEFSPEWDAEIHKAFTAYD